MKKGIISLGLFALVSSLFLIGTNAASEDLLAGVTREGYGYPEPGDSEDGCLSCAHQSSGWKKNTHLENAIGVKNAVDTHGVAEDDDVEVTGVGWISSDHATSQDIGSSARNFYCGWCHSPGDPKVTNDATAATIVA